MMRLEGLLGGATRTQRYISRSVGCLGLLGAAFLPAANALAQSTSNSSAQNPTGSAFGVGLLLVYLTRKREIGGWLFYYYMQLYVGLALTALFTIVSVENFEPSKWARTDQYMWFLISWFPPVLAQCIEVTAATYLLTARTERNVGRLRYAILALLLTTCIAMPIDIIEFKDPAATVLDGMTLVFSAIWLLYFYKSVRVRRVFVDHSWVYHEAPARTPEERRYLRNRAILWAVVLYVLGFVLVGINQGDKKPDPAMLFGLPLVYAILAVLISYICPISKKRRSTLGLPVEHH